MANEMVTPKVTVKASEIKLALDRLCLEFKYSYVYDEKTDIYDVVDVNGIHMELGPGWKCSNYPTQEILAEYIKESRDAIKEKAEGEKTKAKAAEKPVRWTEEHPPITPANAEEAHLNSLEKETQAKLQASQEATQKATDARKAKKTPSEVVVPHQLEESRALSPTANNETGDTGFQTAKRSVSKLRLAIAGVSGSGKTATAGLIAYGICKDWDKIGYIDTEAGSANLYVDQTIKGVKMGAYKVLNLRPPYTPEKYIQALKAAVKAGLKVVIVDSLSHAWSGEGGLLDQHGKIADSGKGNSWTAWRTVTPQHNALVDALLGCPIHVIATLRSKQEHIQEKDDQGHTVIRKVGLAPIQREGLEYEFTTFLDLDIHHQANASKDRTNLFPTDLYFIPGTETGEKLKEWLG